MGLWLPESMVHRATLFPSSHPRCSSMLVSTPASQASRSRLPTSVGEASQPDRSAQWEVERLADGYSAHPPQDHRYPPS